MARDEAEALKTQGKTVRILCVGRKGYDILKRNYSDELLAPVSYQGLKSVGFTEAQTLQHRCWTILRLVCLTSARFIIRPFSL